MLTTTEVFDNDFLQILNATSESWGTTVFGLFTNPVSESKRLTLADLHEPTYPSYARVPTGFLNFARAPDGTIHGVQFGSFQQTGVPVPQTVVGWFAACGALPYLAAFEMFAAPIAMTDDLVFAGIMASINQSSARPGFTTVLQ